MKLSSSCLLFSALVSVLALCFVAVTPRSAAAEDSQRVAVLYFDNPSNPELEPLKVGLAQMLITDLTGSPGVEVVERARLQAILDELELGHSGKVDDSTAARVGKLLGARWLVLGSYFEMMGTLRIDARLVRVETAEIVGSHGVNDAVGAFMGMEKLLAAALRSDLDKQTGNSPSPRSDSPKTRSGSGPAPVAPGSSEGAEAKGDLLVLPSSKQLEAAVAFSEGLIYLDKQDLPRAREAFESAVVANPALDAAKAELAKLDI